METIKKASRQVGSPQQLQFTTDPNEYNAVYEALEEQQIPKKHTYP